MILFLDVLIFLLEDFGNSESQRVFSVVSCNLLHFVVLVDITQFQICVFHIVGRLEALEVVRYGDVDLIKVLAPVSISFEMFLLVSVISAAKVLRSHYDLIKI